MLSVSSILVFLNDIVPVLARISEVIYFEIACLNMTSMLKDRQQEAQHHMRYIALLSSSSPYNIISYTKR